MLVVKSVIYLYMNNVYIHIIYLYNVIYIFHQSIKNVLSYSLNQELMHNYDNAIV